MLLPRWLPKVPGSIVALFAGTAVVALLIPVATIGTTFGGIPSGLPSFSVPEFRADLILPLLQPAFTVAVLAALESLLSAVVADSMTGDATTRTRNWWRRASPTSSCRWWVAFR